MVVINPGYIVGPNFVMTDFTSGSIVIKIMTGKMPGFPRSKLPAIDVRDCAMAHV